MTRWLSQLSHITFRVNSAQQLASNLINRFRFLPLAFRITKGARQFALKQGSAIFVINETPVIPTSSSGQRPVAGNLEPLLQGTMASSEEDLLYDIGLTSAVDTVSNVCFEVEDMQSLFKHLSNHDCRILVPPSRVEDDLGFVTYSIVKSVVGNVCHTLIDRSKYTGEFLPGFQMIEHPGTKADDIITHFDHLTYSCPRQSTWGILEWYERCFGFKRFQLSMDDDPEEGYIIKGAGVGLRLTAMHYWKCSEVGLSLPSTNQARDCKFVIAESLPGQGRNQVDTFLELNGGAGIQHVGLYTPDILTAAQMIRDAGVPFVTQPPDYYREIAKKEDICAAGHDPHLLSQLNILLDGELRGSKTPQGEARRQYLMQVFTQPIFSEETFFLELIQRHGASGFGEGNIRALWRAVEAYMDRQQKAL
ncbi:4-hydroxyphenylpyruvate dioxygenase-like protein [Ambystoma mexicanum]|uniref:4-hydroxyphenylpyruvate dioxygenase-like protein n=1 Tax=Ambystoma mexicanum TaxID=8296 RepID=UPI0037E711BF